MKTWQFPWLLLITTIPAISQAAPNTMPNMQEGLWEITTKIEISGMARGLPPHTVQHCVTKRDIEEGQGRLHQPEQKNSNCQIKHYQVEGNKASWSLACAGSNPITGSGTVTYNGDSFAGTTFMKVGDKSRETEMTQTFSGRRLGVCKE